MNDSDWHTLKERNLALVREVAAESSDAETKRFAENNWSLALEAGLIDAHMAERIVERHSRQMAVLTFVLGLAIGHVIGLI